MQLNATPRTKDEKTSSILADKQLPLAVYGPKTDPISVKADYQEFYKLIKAALFHTVFDLVVDGKTMKAIIKDYAMDPVKDTLIHADLYIIDESQKITVPVPVVFEGESPAMRTGALLTVTMPKIKITCLPKDIPAGIIADITPLENNGDKIRVADLNKPENVEFVPEDNVMVAKTELSRAGKKAAGEDEEGEEGATEGAAETTEEA